MHSRNLFSFSAAVEVLTGIALLFAPGLVVELLLGEGLMHTGVAVSRVLGIALLSLGVSAWETVRQQSRQAVCVGICIYNVAAAGLLTLYGTMGEMHGMFLWPAAGLHGLIAIAMLATILASFQNHASQ